MTEESWTVHAFLCDHPQGCNALSDDAENVDHLKVMADEDGWFTDGDRHYCPRHRREAMLLKDIRAYVCPAHILTGGYESCCICDGWPEGDPNEGRKCDEALER